MDAEFICSEIERNREEIIKLSLALWENPEGPYEEFKASAWTADLLEKHGFEVEREAGGIKTAVKACFGTGRPVIGFLGEYDALPGLSQTRAGSRTEIRPRLRSQPDLRRKCGRCHCPESADGAGSHTRNNRILRLSGGRGSHGKALYGACRSV